MAEYLRCPSSRTMTASSVLVATLLLLSISACRPSSPVVPTTVTSMPRVPILLLTVDALRADHLSIYGYPRDTAPALTRLAEDAVVFERAFTPCPRTSPAYASLFTGKYPHGHGLRQLGQELAGENLTLAELLAGAGYSSRGFVSSTVLVGQLSGLDQGFDAWDDLLPVRERNRENYQRIAADTVASVARELDGGWQPGFLFLHLIDPHGPYAAPEPRSFAPGPAAAASGLFEPSLVPEYQRLDQRPRLRDYIDAYDAEISYADAGLGRLLGRLRQTDSLRPGVDSGHGRSRRGIRRARVLVQARGDTARGVDQGAVAYQAARRVARSGARAGDGSGIIGRPAPHPARLRRGVATTRLARQQLAGPARGRPAKLPRRVFYPDRENQQVGSPHPPGHTAGLGLPRR
ncbi:MAG: sulfatase-like hydrolase/transferase [Proteobacteria bacterium]|nr:sulfatase-like hydrolase/transferase [Pseudomonadota bacterium]